MDVRPRCVRRPESLVCPLVCPLSKRGHKEVIRRTCNENIKHDHRFQCVLFSRHRNHQPARGNPAYDSTISRRARAQSSSSWLAAAFSMTVFVASMSAVWLAPAVSASGSGSSVPVFGREVIVDHQRVTGEPSLAIDSKDRIYVSAPFGFSTTASFVWRSTDHGKTFHLVPGNLPPYGKPNVTCAGGGDSALVSRGRKKSPLFCRPSGADRCQQ